MNHYFKIALRNLAYRPVYAIITFSGFTLGIVASILIFLWVNNELSYEKFHPDYQQIYRVLTLSKQGNEIIKSSSCSRMVAKTLKMDYPQIEYATYISYGSEDSPLQKESGGEKIEARRCVTNSDFFNVFKGFRFIEGSPESALKNPDNIVLSEKTAKKLFGNQSALGQSIISDKYYKDVYIVGGVITIPEQSHIDFGFLLSEKNNRYSLYSDSWVISSDLKVYFKLTNNAVINKQFLSSISDHLGRYSKSNAKLIIQPLTDIHLHSEYQDTYYDKNLGSIKNVWLLSGLALLIMLMASLNFSILSVARISERSTEIGIRKVNGAGKAGIFWQFMAESVLQTFLATIAALIIISILLPLFIQLSGTVLNLTITWRFIFTMLLLTLIVGIIAGLYPSTYLSSFNPIGIFRGGNVTGSKNNFIKLLVTIQFSIAIFFIIAMSLFVKQINYIQKKDLGINGDNVVVIPTGLWYDNKAFKEELLTNPNIISVSASSYAPVDFTTKGGFSLNHLGSMDTLQVFQYGVDEDFAKTYKVEVLRGQFLQKDYYRSSSENENANKSSEKGKNFSTSIPIVINETAEKMFAFEDPIGHRIKTNIIVGVVKDFHFRSLHYPIGPMIMTNDQENIMTMNIRISHVNKSETIDFIGNTYKKFRDDREFSYSFFDDLLNKEYESDKRLKNITIALGLFSIIISIMGILGMAMFAMDRRTKEIGIRKISGANTIEILVLLNKEFIKWVLVAFVISTPVSWYLMHLWLQNFAFKTEFSWWIFVLAGFISIAIALITVSWESLRIARRDPVEALRNE